jgi:ribosome-associated heat shock protein Hsp15
MANERRLDQWLWFARLFKSRTQAAEAITAGAIRLNRQVVAKPGQSVKPEDILTFVRGSEVLVVRVKGPGTRRGPAPEARELYEIIES